MSSLAECHGQLADSAIRELAALFQPFLSEVPGELARTSERGIAWAFLVRLADKRGPAVVLEHEHFFARSRLDEHAAPGDLITLHLSIEQLAETWGSARSRDPEERGGGLRRPTFVSMYPGIRGKAKRALDLLIENSPLTRLVYADLASAVPMRLSPRSLEPLLTAGRGAWIEIWTAQLARSFLAALLGASRDMSELRSVEAEIALLRNTQRRSASLEALATRLRARIADDVAGRFKAARLLEPRADGACPQRHLLRMRFLDMLVRHLVTAWMPRLIEEWKIRSDRSFATPMPLLTTGESCREFETAILKLRARQFMEILSEERRGELRDNIFGVLNPPALSTEELEQLADESGVPRTAVKRMKQRLSDPAVRLPFGRPGSLKAETLLEMWLTPLNEAIPSRAPVTTTDESKGSA